MPVVVPSFQQRAYGVSDAIAVRDSATLPWSDSFGAALDSGLDRNFAGSATRWMDAELDLAFGEGQDVPAWRRAVSAGVVGAMQFWRPLARYFSQQKPKLLSGEEATKEFGIDGQLKFSGAISERAAADIRRLKVRELEQKWILQNTESGAGSFVSGLAGGFVSGFADPVNIGMMFLPIGWFRNLGIVKNMAATRPVVAEMTANALQNAAGTALLEPVIASNAWREQADYTAVDSGMNILFGAGMGAAAPFVEAGLRRVASSVTKRGDIRERFGDITNSAIYENMASRVDAGETLNSGEIGRIVDLDPAKIRADIEAGKRLSLEEFRDWQDSEPQRLEADTRSPDQIAMDESAMRELVNEETVTRMKEFSLEDGQRGSQIKDIAPRDISKALLETDDTEALAQAMRAEAESLEAEIAMPSDPGIRRLHDEIMREANDAVEQIPKLKEIADALIDCVTSP